MRALLTWFLETDDEATLRTGLSEMPPPIWPGFSAEAAAELQGEDSTRRELHRRLLGEERRRREY